MSGKLYILALVLLIGCWSVVPQAWGASERPAQAGERAAGMDEAATAVKAAEATKVAEAAQSNQATKVVEAAKSDQVTKSEGAEKPDATKTDDAKADEAEKPDAAKADEGKDMPAGDNKDDKKDEKKPKIVVNEKAGTVTVPAAVAEQGKYDELKGAIEYLLVSKGGKSYETVFTTECRAEEIHAALVKLGLKGGSPADEENLPKGTAVEIRVEYELKNEKVSRPAEEFIAYIKTGKALEAQPWTFTGSAMAYDPETEKDTLQARLTQNVVGLHYGDRSPLLQNPRAECRTENIYRANKELLPAAGTEVRLVFKRAGSDVPAGTRRVHVFISGRVQGVGFRAFTQRQAKELKLTGWVKNLKDGRVEAVVEGPREQVAELLKQVEKGPRSARVDKVETADETPQGDFKEFEVRR